MKKLEKFWAACLILVTSSVPSFVGAISPQDLRAINLDTVFYDPSVSPCETQGSARLIGGDNIEQAFNYFIQKGLTKEQSAGIVGNLRAESGVIPKRVQGSGTILSDTNPLDGRTGYGIAQWTTLGRQQGLNDFSKADPANRPIYDLGLQLDYLWQELNGSYKATVLDPLKKTATLRDATVLVLHKYEAPQDQSLSAEDARTKLAQDVLDNYQPSGSSAGGGGGCGATTTTANIIKYQPPLPTSGTIKPTGIVIHWWGSNSGGQGIKALARGLAGNTSCPGGCSVQLGILKDGKTYQMTSQLNSRAIHATCANDSTIGIEMEGVPADFGASGPTKRPQEFQAVVATVKFLMDKYQIPLKGEASKNSGFTGVYSHKQVDAICGQGVKSDVDNEYLAAVIKALQEGGAQ